MFFRYRRGLFRIIVGALLPAALSAQDLASIPTLQSRVSDTVNLLSDEEIERIEALSARLEERKGSQIAVLTVASTEPESIEQYAIRVAEQWKIGRAGVDDGIILIVAHRDRKVRIEVGYGLEGAVPDAAAKRIIEEDLVPNFRFDRYGAGIEAAVESLIERIEPEALPPPTFEERADAFLLEQRGWIDEYYLPFVFVVLGLCLVIALARNSFVLGLLLPVGLIAPAALPIAYFLHVEWLVFTGVFFMAYLTVLLLIYGNMNSSGRGGSRSSSGYRSSGYSSSSYSSNRSYSSSSSSSSSWSGGGGSFGGGGASGSW